MRYLIDFYGTQEKGILRYIEIPNPSPQDVNEEITSIKHRICELIVEIDILYILHLCFFGNTFQKVFNEKFIQTTTGDNRFKIHKNPPKPDRFRFKIVLDEIKK